MAYFTQADKQIYYEGYGNTSDPCLILISGLGSQLIAWDPRLVLNLTQLGLYVILFDNRDSGLSFSCEQLQGTSFDELKSAQVAREQLKPPYSLGDMAQDIVQLMDHLAISQAHIAGISMGGMIAQVFAIHYPERTLSLICIATTSQDSHLPPPHDEILNYMTSTATTTETFESMIENKVNSSRLYHHPDYFNEAKAREYCIKAYQRAYNPQGFARQMMAIASAQPRGELLKQLQTPSLIIHGTCDPIFPIEHAYYLAEVLPINNLKIIENMGHGLLEDFQETIVLAIADHIKMIAA